MSKLKIGAKAPVFRLNDLGDRPVSNADFLGKIVLINFWSAECPWAEQADRVLAQSMQSAVWQGKVILLQVASNENEPDDLLHKVAAERAFPLVLRDTGHSVADLYGAETTPHCFVVDGEGVLRYQGGFDDITFRQRNPTRRYALEAVNALLKGEPPPLEDAPAFGCTIVRYQE